MSDSSHSGHVVHPNTGVIRGKLPCCTSEYRGNTGLIIIYQVCLSVKLNVRGMDEQGPFDECPGFSLEF